MDNYWLSKAAETEAYLDQLRVEFEETTKAYKDRIEELENEVQRVIAKAGS